KGGRRHRTDDIQAQSLLPDGTRHALIHMVITKPIANHEQTPVGSREHLLENFKIPIEEGLATELPRCISAYQNMAEDHTCKGMGECHPYREFEGMQPSR